MKRLLTIGSVMVKVNMCLDEVATFIIDEFYL